MVDLMKAQRLSHNLSVVSDMVKYSDICGDLLSSHLVSPEENHQLLRKVTTEGNQLVMQELLAMVTLRRGGFEAFTKALRNSDYAWLASQLDPSPSSEESEGLYSTKRSSLISKISKKINRKSEPGLSSTVSSESDAIFLSYRDECPIDIPINPSYYYNSSSEMIGSKASSNWSLLNPSDKLQNDEDLSFNLTPMSISKNEEGPAPTSDSAGTGGSLAVLYNFPPPQDHLQGCEEFLQKLARKAEVPSPTVKDLKVLHPSSKKKLKKKDKVKIQFSSEARRNLFIQQVSTFLGKLEPQDDLSKVKVRLPRKEEQWKMKKEEEQRSDKDKAKVTNWYQKTFRFNKWKKK